MSFGTVCLATQVLVWFGAHSFTSILRFWNCTIFTCGHSSSKFRRGSRSAPSCHPLGGNLRPVRVRFRLARPQPEKKSRRLYKFPGRFCICQWCACTEHTRDKCDDHLFSFNPLRQLQQRRGAEPRASMPSVRASGSQEPGVLASSPPVFF